MHHKFAVFDGLYLVTGSYNWTRSAATHNEENIVVSSDPRLVADFKRTFDSLWTRFA
jgi:phosphatidylserine/phosphatidylglycerophosphate/cardiolipin synthase-like enzyme